LTLSRGSDSGILGSFFIDLTRHLYSILFDISQRVETNESRTKDNRIWDNNSDAVIVLFSFSLSLSLSPVDYRQAKVSHLERSNNEALEGENDLETVISGKP